MPAPALPLIAERAKASVVGSGRFDEGTVVFEAAVTRWHFPFIGAR